MNLLLNNGIPSFKKDNGPGGYMNLYFGFSVYGEEIYVDERDYKKASEIIDELSAVQNAEFMNEEEVGQNADTLNEEDSEIVEDDDKDEDFYKNSPFYRNPRILVRIYLLLFIGICILLYIFNK